MTNRKAILKAILGCLLLVPGVLLLAAWAWPLPGIPSCAACQINMGLTSSKVTGTFTKFNANYSTAELVMTYNTGQPSRTMAVPVVGVPMNAGYSGLTRLPQPSKAEIVMCFSYLGGNPCHRTNLQIVFGSGM